MTEFNCDEAALRSGPSALCEMLIKSGAESSCWSAEDLPMLLRHQWSAAVEVDLAELPPKSRHTSLTTAAASGIDTFGAMLTHSAPPLPLLAATKNFFKHKAGRAQDRHVEQQVAYVFYVLVILVAKARYATSISSLSDVDLRKGVAWCLGQPWLVGEPRDAMLRLSQAIPAP